MLGILYKILLYFMASYGVLVLMITIADSVRQRLRAEDKLIKMVLLVKNQEETIEGIIRNIYIGNLLKKIASGNKISIIDMGSGDKTKDILVKLKDDYDFFDLYDKNDKDNIFDSFSD